MNEIMYCGAVYVFRASANNGEVNVYMTMDGTQAVITDCNKKVMFKISSRFSDELCIYHG